MLAVLVAQLLGSNVATFPPALACSDTSDDNAADPPSLPWDKAWTTVQEIEGHGRRETSILMPVGNIHIVVQRQTPGLLPSDTCVALLPSGEPVGGQIARKDGRCEIFFQVQGLPVPYIIGLRNDDYNNHRYTFSFSYSK